MLCTCRHTEQYPEMQIYDDCVVINDAFPKARCHALVIARQEGLNGPADLRPEHLPLLSSMQVTLQIICPIQKNTLLHIGAAARNSWLCSDPFVVLPSVRCISNVLTYVVRADVHTPSIPSLGVMYMSRSV